ncbi:hypothetical protein CWE12_09835 [Aliidiomarina sedimenti]|uniref:Lipoprotein n=1 Tax=Aliidiomarina sedimenti TaxID=1933879 RepID=A0ABY0BXR4_9GAMM|nr:hypothetical protein [Aliidiomarina sedimenti]RUO29275.1 hypothetical protein CWE12_09835 [Aliidiomarina sedimenti]
MRLFFVGIMAVVSAACSPGEETLTFNPEDGEKRLFQVISDASARAETMYGASSDSIKMEMLVDYRVTHEDGLRIDVSPKYMYADFRQGNFASTQQTDGNQDIRDVMEAGFYFKADPDTLEVTEFASNHQSDQFNANEPDLLLDVFRQDATRPGLGHGISIREGATQRVDGTEQLPPLTLTVRSFDEREVVLELQGENDEVKLFGILVVERQSGWLVRATLVSDMRVPDYNNSEVRSVASIYPAEWPYGMDLGFFSHASAMPGGSEEFFTNARAAEEISAEQVFSADSGFIEHFRDRMSLMYPHDSLTSDQAGKMEFSELTAFTLDGEPLDIEWQATDAFVYANYESGDIRSTVDAFALGWNQMHEQLSELAYIEATLNWYPEQIEIVDMALSEDGSELRHGDAVVRFEPTEHEQVYRLSFEQGEKHSFMPAAEGASDSKFDYNSLEGAPEWLELGESRVLAVAERGHFPMYLELFFEDGLPESIKLIQMTEADQPAGQKTARFYDPDVIGNNPRIKPPENVYLRQQQADDFPFSTAPIGSFEVQDMDRPQAFLALTNEQVAACQLELASDELAWQEIESLERMLNGPNRVPDVTVLQLQSKDGRREYFYQQEVTTEITCHAEPAWQTLDWQPTETSWLIDIAVLPQVDPEAPAIDMLRQYRFIAANESRSNGRTLALLPPTAEEAELSYRDSALSDYLVDGQYLRLGGEVARIEQLTMSEEQITQTLVHRFPELPAFESED